MFKDKPIIGLMPLYDKERDSYWMVPGYMKSLEEIGAIPMMLPLTENPPELDYFLEICDGFLLTGGQDIAPELYGAEKKSVCGEISRLRDNIEGIYMPNKKFVWGIQWHPEFSYEKSEYSRKILKAFLEAAK